MPLTLTVRNADIAGSAGSAPPPLRLEGRGAVIGRSPAADWTLPDARNTVSARHCEIAFRNGAYLIADSSTNGTHVNGRRLAAPHRLSAGDVIGIGPYEVIAGLTADAPPPAAPARTPMPAPATPQSRAGVPPITAAADGAVERLLRAAGLRRADVRGDDAEILATAGMLLAKLTAGTTMLLEARTRARAQLGAAPDPDAANPLKRGGAPALALLLGAAQPAERAVADAFADLEAHQLATLQAMQGAMAATLERIAPAALRARAGAGADGAALWRAYEDAFAGTAQARDQSFIELFAQEFRAAYEALARRR